MVNGILKLKQEQGVCKGFTLDKDVKKTFASNDMRSKEILDLIHFDVFGPMENKSLDGHQYCVTFIDVTI